METSSLHFHRNSKGVGGSEGSGGYTHLHGISDVIAWLETGDAKDLGPGYFRSLRYGIVMCRLELAPTTLYRKNWAAHFKAGAEAVDLLSFCPD